MSASPRTWWLIFALVCCVILLWVFLLGLNDREALRPLLENVGLVESLPVLVFLATALLSVAIAFRDRKFLPWGFIALLCIFLAGEEAEWGEDRVLGWESAWFIEQQNTSADLHNWLSRVVKELVSDDARSKVSPAIGKLLGGTALTLAFETLGLAILLGLFAQPGKTTGRSPLTIWRRDLSLQFIITGTALLSFGFSNMLQESLGLPYTAGMWPMEESFELLGSQAFLFAAMIKIVEIQTRDKMPPQRTEVTS